MTRVKMAMVVLLSTVTGCEVGPLPYDLHYAIGVNQLGRARVELARKMQDKVEERDYLLDRLELAIVLLADGYPHVAEPIFARIYDILRTQGINQDKTVASVVLNEDVKFWKGEPFEQALAMHYIGLNHAMTGGWDNLRAATLGAMFHLRDFGTDEGGKRLDNVDLVRNAADRGDDYLSDGYVPVRSNFTLAYLLNGIANQQMGRPLEAQERFQQVLQLDSNLAPLIETLRRDHYNAVFVVDFGIGPRKFGTGPDQAIAKFIARTQSDDQPIIGSVDAEEVEYAPVCDVNALANDHMWNNLEDVRLAKSTVGRALLVGGLVAADYGIAEDDATVAVAGGVAVAAGAVAAAGAHADTRFCRVMPQRVYVVPVRIHDPESRIVLQLRDEPQSRLVLADLTPPAPGETALLRLVRLVTGFANAPSWAQSGVVYYSNDAAQSPGTGGNLPFILGGRCVRTPSYQTLQAYHDAGRLRDITLSQLESLYRNERITWRPTADGIINFHVLEGGRSLIAPLPGTVGYARLFGQLHAPYEPKSAPVRSMQQRIAPAPCSPSAVPATKHTKPDRMTIDHSNAG